MSRKPEYPFAPKSVAYLRAGHFWDIPLLSGRWACGRVVFTPQTPGVADVWKLSNWIFAGGLLDWSGDDLPASEAIAGCQLLDWGQMHVLSLSDAGSRIRGWRDLAVDGLTGLRHTDSTFGGYLYEDGRELEPAPGYHDPAIHQLRTWGRGIISILAEEHFG